MIYCIRLLAMVQCVQKKGVVPMENINITLAANILKFRKRSGLTQDELAQKLGVSFQAVSKWENAKSAPDIAFLPQMADLFGCYIDELFSREVKQETHYDHCCEFPWADDTVIRGVVCEGRKILKVADGLVDKFTFEIVGDAKNVKSECNIYVDGNVTGGCSTGRDLTVSGKLEGNCACGREITVGGGIVGSCTVGRNVTCGTVSGNITCKEVNVSGDVEAQRITGNVMCKSIKCDRITGRVTIKGDN